MKITALILAGGRGSRMGDVDKGLQPFQGRAMVAYVIARLRPQCDELLINANRNLEAYAGFGHRVVPDAIDGFAGPLAGLHIGMTHATHPLIVTAPCDSPFLPLDLVARLRASLERENADLAVAKTFDQPHPVFCLTRTALAGHLRDFLATGQRKIDKWYATLKVVEVPFDDEEAAFANINTVDELRAMERNPGTTDERR
ncbi:MAG TPA: molybdenum cofactor guanylyltransferase MobA [Usitatibacteraceae bacterium]|nr:molybdenum cofactor guanylyltransferase MobA [Usitatibacteraceae bacterium]